LFEAGRSEISSRERVGEARIAKMPSREGLFENRWGKTSPRVRFSELRLPESALERAISKIGGAKCPLEFDFRWFDFRKTLSRGSFRKWWGEMSPRVHFPQARLRKSPLGMIF